MKVLDLFAGLGGWSAPFVIEGHEVLTLDADPRFGCDITEDILRWDPRSLPWRPDIILASPPCETFSVASIGTHWAGGWRVYEPKTYAAHVGMEIVLRTVRIIEDLRPAVAVIENPRGVLRKLSLIPGERETVWLCHYGDERAKPTDLWGMPFPENWEPRPACHNQRATHPVGCCCRDHEGARRGAKTGTQGLQGADRALIPFELAASMLRSHERSVA